MLLIDQDIELTGKLKIDSGVIEVETPEGTREIAYTTEDGRWSIFFNSTDNTEIVSQNGKVLYDTDEMQIRATSSASRGGIIVAPKMGQMQVQCWQSWSITSGQVTMDCGGKVTNPGESVSYTADSAATRIEFRHINIHIGNKCITILLKKGSPSGGDAGQLTYHIMMW